MGGFYSVFGGRVSSEIALPELPEAANGPADWALYEGRSARAMPNAALLGSSMRGRCEVTLWRSDDAFHLRHTCVGEYDISLDGSRFTCWRDSDSSNEAVQNDVIGRLIPLAFHARGALCLHASGVTIGECAVAFVGEPRIGKSTLAYALVREGSSACSDDVVILQTQPAVVMRSGVPRLRLCRDATSALVQTDSARRSPFDGKDVIELKRDDAAAVENTPLKAIYLLAPFEGTGSDSPVRRVQLQSHTATLLLVRHARLGRVLSGSAAGDMVVRAAAVVRTVPVYVLHVMRDLQRIREIAAELMRWHGAPAMAAAAGT